MGRAESTSRADRAVQTRHVQSHHRRLLGTSIAGWSGRLVRSEIANASADNGAENRADERQGDSDDRTYGGGNRGPFREGIFQHRPAPFAVCYSYNTHGCPSILIQGFDVAGSSGWF